MARGKNSSSERLSSSWNRENSTARAEIAGYWRIDMKHRALWIAISCLLVPVLVALARGQQFEIDQEEKNSNEFQPPNKVMDAAGVRAGMVIGEVGAGKGRYTVYLAHRIGPEGKVYANDIDEKSLAFLKDRCQKQGFANIETVLGTTADPSFPKGQLDLIFMTWVYHHLEHPVALLRNLIPSLKPGGTVVIVDPDPIKNRGGRSPENRSPDQIRREAGEAGFEVVRIKTFLKLDNLYVLKVRGRKDGSIIPID